MENVTASDNMFSGCRNLLGGNGTTYDSAYTDKTYARVDTIRFDSETGEYVGERGYLTLK